MILERHIDGCIRQTTPYGLTQFKILLSILRAKKSAAKASTKSIGKIAGRSAHKSASHDCSQAAIAEGWGVSEAAISRQINMLVKDKLITKGQDPEEMRRSVLGLTAKGKAFVSKTMRTVDKELAKIFRPVSKTGRNQLTANLNRVTELLLEHMPHCDILT